MCILNSKSRSLHSKMNSVIELEMESTIVLKLHFTDLSEVMLDDGNECPRI